MKPGNNSKREQPILNISHVVTVHKRLSPFPSHLKVSLRPREQMHQFHSFMHITSGAQWQVTFVVKGRSRDAVLAAISKQILYKCVLWVWS